MNTPTLETKNLILRKFTENDLQALYEIYSDREVNVFLPWFPVETPEETRELLEKRYLSVYRKDRGWQYAICLKADNVPIGYIGVGAEEPYELGYGLKKEFWHRGIVTEAAEAIIAHLKKTDIPYIIATHDRNNPRSGGVMRNVGMKYCYSYEEQWQPKNIPVIFRMYQLNFDGNDDRVYGKFKEMYPVNFVEEI